VRDTREISRRDLSVKTCARLFPNQEVMQTACISSCRSPTAGDGQECAFSYSRSLHEVVVDQPGSAMMVTTITLFGALICGACWAVVRARRKTQAG
jgi:hypothetical protein